jgi:L,D-transpeptidase catalytic domain
MVFLVSGAAPAIQGSFGAPRAHHRRWRKELTLMRLPVMPSMGRTVVVGLLGAAAPLLAGTAGASAVPNGPPCIAAARACVDLAAQQAWLMRDGDVIYGPVPVATGKTNAPTDPGTFHVAWKDLHHRSSEFHNAPMPYSVFFNGGDAFHEDSVIVRSHGCVHLAHPAAQTFYSTLHVGDVVQVVR